jgi:DNA mismatch endonuclease (patch repair protein)
MMASIKSRNTRAELILRRALFLRGIRYRIHASGVHGTPDVSIKKYKVAVFVDGDFWHGNAWRLRGLSSLEGLFPSRTEWWTNKIRRNERRDAEVTASLQRLDWTVIRIWESDILKSADVCAQRVLEAIAAQAQERSRISTSDDYAR